MWQIKHFYHNLMWNLWIVYQPYSENLQEFSLCTFYQYPCDQLGDPHVGIRIAKWKGSWKHLFAWLLFCGKIHTVVPTLFCSLAIPSQSHMFLYPVASLTVILLLNKNIKWSIYIATKRPLVWSTSTNLGPFCLMMQGTMNYLAMDNPLMQL